MRRRIGGGPVERLDGGEGDYLIDATASFSEEVEHIFGDENNDTIEAVDGEVDIIDCGTGSDTVFYDVGIDVVAGNC